MRDSEPGTSVGGSEAVQIIASVAIVTEDVVTMGLWPVAPDSPRGPMLYPAN